MSDPESFLTAVSVLVDDLVARDARAGTRRVRRPGPPPALSTAETVTLAVFSQWGRFQSERDFYRYAEARLRPLFPRLPSRPQFNRQVRRLERVIARIGGQLAATLAGAPAYEVLDSTAVATRNAKRRGRSWLGQEVDIGWSSRLGWYAGMHVLTCVTPTGVLTGIGAGPASVNDRHLAETFLAVRAHPHAALATVGHARGSLYLADKGFGGQGVERHWLTTYGVAVLSPPQADRRSRVWSPALSAWLKTHRQIVETVHGRCLQWFRLGKARPHTIAGARILVAATFVLHNVTIWLNRRAGRPDLAIAEVLGW